jgi:hypothetical protein
MFQWSVRWWIAEQSAARLLLSALGALALFAAIVAVGQALTRRAPSGVSSRLGDAHGMVNAWLEALRPSVGSGDLQVQAGNTSQEALATVTSVVGSLVPAIAIGVVFIRLFSVRPFVWRSKAAVCLASECDFAEYAHAHQRSSDAMITVRFYNRFYKLAMVDLRCRVYLRYLARSVDGSLVLRKVALKQLNGRGEPDEERSWPSLELGSPFTAWIPLDAPVPCLPVTAIQGHRVPDDPEVKLHVRLTAKIVGMGIEVVDERWFTLGAHDMEIGRFVPVRPAPGMAVRDWDGWQDFDEVRPLPAAGTQASLAHRAASRLRGRGRRGTH